MSFKSRLKQSVKDYGTSTKCGIKVAYHMAKGSSVDELNKAAQPIEEILMNSQRMKDAQKVGLAVGAAMWTGIICAIVD
jgi:hypothetical protein